MAEFFADPYFVTLWLPCITVAVVVLFKSMSRNDKFGLFCKEDLAVGIDLAVASVFTFAVHVGVIAQKSGDVGMTLSQSELRTLSQSPWVLLGMLIGLVTTSLVTRSLGWKSKTEMTWFFGIITSFAYGLTSLVMVAKLITS